MSDVPVHVLVEITPMTFQTADALIRQEEGERSHSTKRRGVDGPVDEPTAKKQAALPELEGPVEWRALSVIQV